MSTNEPNAPSLSLKAQLNAAHDGLLRLHKALLEYEKVQYEVAHPRIKSPGEFLNLLINDPWFAWLRPASRLIADIDEFVSSKKPTDPRAGETLLAQARLLLAPADDGNEFQQKYQKAIQESADIAHVSQTMPT